jgi:hypothetical protein
MTVEITALLLTVLAHLVGAAVLVANLLDGDADWRGSLWPRDDDDRGPEPPPPPAPPGDGTASPVRLRQHGRIGDAYPPPARRPEHAPEHAPERTPERAPLR